MKSSDPKTSPSQKVAVRIPADLAAFLQNYADANGRTLSNTICFFLRAGIDLQKAPADVARGEA